MKRIVITIGVGLVLLGSASPVQALDYYQLGIKSGVNLSRLEDDKAILSEIVAQVGGIWDQQFRLGLVVGGFGQVELSPDFLLRAEALFTMKGEKYEPAAEGSYTVQLSYIETPLLVVLRLPVDGNVRPGLFAGPSLGLEVSSEASAKGAGEPVTGILPLTNSLEVSLVLGLELAFDDRYSLEARLTRGLTNIDDSGLPSEVTNQTISVLAGLAFDIFNY